MLNTLFSPWPSFTAEGANAVQQVLLSNKVNYWTGTATQRPPGADLSAVAGGSGRVASHQPGHCHSAVREKLVARYAADGVAFFDVKARQRGGAGRGADRPRRGALRICNGYSQHATYGNSFTLEFTVMWSTTL